MKIFSIAIIMIFLTLSLHGQNISIEKTMYVTSENGLRQRDRPSLNGSVMGTFLFGERIEVAERTNTLETIDGITDYWYKTQRNGERWIFGGYLSEEFPPNAQVLLGVWYMINESGEWSGIIYRFRSDYTLMIYLYEKGEILRGTWERNNNTIALKFTSLGGEDFSNVIEVNAIRLQEIDRSNIILHFENGNIPSYYRTTDSVRLLRSNDPWHG